MLKLNAFKFFKMKNVFYFCFTILLFSCKKTKVVDSNNNNNNNTTQLFERLISPSTVNSAVTAYNSQHYVYIDTVALRNKLFVFLPGTTGSPQFYKLIVKKAAAMGYHSIGLMYPNNSDLYTAAASNTDNTQFGKCRQEIIEGIDLSTGVTVDNNNCIKTRLYQLLVYLQQLTPSQNWQQFILNNDIDWSKVVIAGHSQGGGHALFISKLYSVDKAISFSSIDWNSNLGRSADWVTQPGATDVARLYSFNGIRDQIFSYANVQTQLAEMGFTGPAVSIDSTQPPYFNSHTLTTSATPATSVLFPDHNITSLDSYVPKNNTGGAAANFDAAWGYLLGN